MTFTYPWFLWGLLAVVIPIAIHLFELRRPQRLVFTNVGFIREIKIVTARQRKVKQWLILLARIFFLIFLVLMFCQPFIPARKSTAVAGEVVAVVDASPSMQVLGNTDQPIFERALSEARDLPNAYAAGTRFILPGHSEKLAAGAFQTEIDKLAISGNAVSALGAVQRVKAGNDKVGQLFIFSDFQKNSFDARMLPGDSTNQVFLVPLAGKPTQNVFVDSVMLDDAFVRAGADIPLRIRLRNGGSLAAPDCQVKVFVGKRQVAAYRTTVQAQSTAVSVIRVRLEGNNIQQCRIELEDFPVTFDNTYFFTLQPSAQIKVLDISNSETANTSRVYSNEPLFDYASSSAQNSDYRRLATANLTLVQELPQVGTGLREALRANLQKGGTVVIVPPASSGGRSSYDQLFRALGLGALQWEPVPQGPPVLQDVAEPSVQNPFFREVFAGQRRQAVMPKAAPVIRWSRSTTDVLRLRGGDGYLAGFASGRGMVYLFAAPFGGGYSDFSSHALFVPVLYRLAMQSYRANQGLAYRLNQGSIAVELGKGTGAAAGESVVKLVKDSLTFIPSQRLQAGTLRFEIPPSMRAPGFYTLMRSGTPLTTLAFNFDKRESNLTSYSAAELRQLIGPNRPNVQVYEAGVGQSVAAQYKAERVGMPLWRYCLWLALASLLAEVLLLRLLGRTRRAQPAAVAA
ncbi:N-terminal double-transmembrane domain-containing protein [Hymenobacter daecheongensis DSM 21074]|uniref:N-terminal double-transmembrane domain-containing protein n=1 Tax=Hymenobacter daecheongensis DSM 21074 TaxID=1121955 RepID=A0A1M6KYW0_9BACT|nr:BatA domain-containing protein [Hymenobacter daecheongensis]SHJ64036.1 N-terminal double-transmembrane domain-containing protein [Hymenobacter daecheongensis DSM 21074]